MNFPNPQLDQLLSLALTEDIGPGDITTAALIDRRIQAKACLWVKEEGVVAGLPVARRVFALLGQPDMELLVADGTKVEPAREIARIEGPAHILLQGERLALNFLQRLSGIATVTNRIAKMVAPYGVRLVDTRKTTPIWRALEKYAVVQGGGYNHRFGLFDAVLIKDNHIQVVGGVAAAVKNAKEKVGHMVKICVEVKNINEVREALRENPDTILLDNMTTGEMKEAVDIIGGRVLVEASGNINESNAVSIAKTGVDIMSSGALTHSPKALDISMDLDMV